jgi:non-canonical purine NTP pyrophosphatase (RdgB/HAM1 family)
VELLIATGNPGKAREFRELLGDAGIVWRSLKDFSGDAAVPETGRTFAENAHLKAAGYATRYHLWTLADDSGLEVDALSKSPGVYSARWAEQHNAGSGDEANNRLLLQQLADIPADQRTGRFLCALALCDPAGKLVLSCQDSVEGHILRSPRGSNGFGYDPLFVPNGFERTTAELDAAEKHRISHRGKALRQLKSLIAGSGLFSGHELTTDSGVAKQ